MARACSLIPTAEPLPSSPKSKGALTRFSDGGCSLTTGYKPHMVSQHSLEAPTAGSRDLTHSCAVCPYILPYPSMSRLWR
jgi:hypothetical protein